MMTGEELEKMRKEHWMHGVEDLLQIIWARDRQIATLKEIVRLDRLEYIDPSLPDLGSAEDVVDKQLAQEYPEIFGGKE